MFVVSQFQWRDQYWLSTELEYLYTVGTLVVKMGLKKVFHAEGPENFRSTYVKKEFGVKKRWEKCGQ